jgi:IS605 OrfB family transposase
MAKINSTAKIQITCSKEDYSKIRKLLRISAMAATHTTNMCMSRYGIACEKYKEMSKDEKNFQLRDMYAELNKFVKEYAPDIDKVSKHLNNVLATVEKKYRGECKDVLKGLRSYATYKSFPVYVTGACLRKSLPKYSFLVYGMQFDLFFGKDNSGNREIIKKCISGEFEARDSKIIEKDNKLFLLLTFSHEVISIKTSKDKILGIDLGIAVPIYGSIYGQGGYLKLGDIDTLFKPKMAIEKKRRNLQSSIKLAKGGHGRKRKLKALDSMADKESNFRKTINHTLSKRVIDYCLCEGVGTIVMEKLSGFKGNDRMLRHWTYFDLQTKLENKAAKYGIDVHLVNPRYTSQRCSKCGHIHKDNRKSQSSFECVECGYGANADYNASINISELFLGKWDNTDKDKDE